MRAESALPAMPKSNLYRRKLQLHRGAGRRFGRAEGERARQPCTEGPQRKGACSATPASPLHAACPARRAQPAPRPAAHLSARNSAGGSSLSVKSRTCGRAGWGCEWRCGVWITSSLNRHEPAPQSLSGHLATQRHGNGRACPARARARSASRHEARGTQAKRGAQQGGAP